MRQKAAKEKRAAKDAKYSTGNKKIYHVKSDKKSEKVSINEENLNEEKISTKVNIITPGLNRVLGNPYIVKVERKIPNVEDKQ